MGGEDNLLTSLLYNKARFNDVQVSEALRGVSAGNCFTGGFLVDITSLDIQRGRRHNLPNYNDLRKIYHGRGSVYRTETKCPAHLDEVSYINETDPIECFEQAFPSTYVTLIRDTFKKVKNVDPWIGMALEADTRKGRGGRDAITGVVQGNIIGEQMFRTRKGDRFFYTHAPDLTAEEREEIETISMSTILRWFFPNVDVPNNPFQVPITFEGEQLPLTTN
jgi:Animal haem peroxidase